MDFFRINVAEKRGGVLEVAPDWIVKRSKDLMVLAQSFYAIWDDANSIWSTDEFHVVELVDKMLWEYAETLKEDGIKVKVKTLNSFTSASWTQFKKYMKNLSDNSTQLDQQLTFANTEVKKTDYVSKRLPYSLARGTHRAWDELVGILYAPSEREKIEWAIGALVSGDSKTIHKFLVFYGPPGSGKGTILNILQAMFVGYTTTFEAKALVGNNNNFATEMFRNNPLVAIQHDGDLSKIEDNSKLNSIISHEDMTMNVKFKSAYTSHVNAFLFMGTNKPVKISDAQSGLLRRLIDVHPSGDRIDSNHYNALLSQIEFEYGAIAQHCLDVYRDLGKNYYKDYRPLEMMFHTDVFFNFVEYSYEILKEQDGVSLKQAWEMYKEYVTYAKLEYSLPLHKFREELKHYFDDFEERPANKPRSWYSGFNAHQYKVPIEASKAFSLVLDEDVSLLDELLASYPAQLGKADSETPRKYWTDDERLVRGKPLKPKPEQVCDTVLSDIDTRELHFLKVPDDHIVIDFDLKDDSGEKSREANLEAASVWPATYAELSKSGEGVHLHYNYTGGDVGELAAEYSDGIEIKVYRGNSSLRRKLTKCNNVPVADINSGLPFKKEKSMIANNVMHDELSLRNMIQRNLRKEIHSGTKPSIDFIFKLLNDMYASGLPYDVSDLKPRIITFAVGSSNQAETCLRLVQQMKFRTDDSLKEYKETDSPVKDKRIVFFDVEVYPNLFTICWKRRGIDGVVRMINPSPQEIEALLTFRLVGFYNRNYDNHILWAAFMGANNQQLYQLSQKLVTSKPGDNSMKFGQAFNLSYADIHDFATKKQGLKHWEIELGVHHKELDIPWDEPVPEERWIEVLEYNENDVLATEAVFEACIDDFHIREMLADMSGLTVNDTTRSHFKRIMFGNDKNPQLKFVYTDLSTIFPGYEFDKFAKTDKSTYRGEIVGEGGLVRSKPGMYKDVAVLDISSMHPSSIRKLNLFGPYTQTYTELLDARLAIQSGDYEAAAKALDGRLAEYLKDETSAKNAANGMKLGLNSTYGWTSTTWPNEFKDPRNIDNIVAKIGALYMVDLMHAVEDLGYKVVHIKTDSIKIADADEKIIEFVQQHGRDFGYDFKLEDTYKRMCLVNDAVLVALVAESVKKGKVVPEHWKAVGTQFQVPYVFKTIFTKDEITFDDLCVTKSVQKGHMYLDFDAIQKPMFAYEGMHFVGRVGRFTPIHENAGGGQLVCLRDGKKTSPTGTKGTFWVESELLKSRINTDIEQGTNFEDDTVDFGYFDALVDEAIINLNRHGDVISFVNGSDEDYAVFLKEWNERKNNGSSTDQTKAEALMDQ